MRSTVVWATLAVAVLTACGAPAPPPPPDLAGRTATSATGVTPQTPPVGAPSAAASVAASTSSGSPLSAAEVRRTLGAEAASDPVIRRLVWTQDAAHVLHAEVSGAEAEAVWRRLRSVVGSTRRWPVVRGATGEQMPLTDVPDVGATLAQAEKFDRTTWLAARARENDLETGPMGRVLVASGPRFPGHEFFSVRDSLSGDFLPSVDVALVPDPRPWAAAAYLSYGGWNDCPEAAAHVALMHEWYTRWGAEPFAFVDDVQVEMWVPRPPRTIGEAMPLGQVHYVYAYDNVLQGTADVTTREEYASSLIGRKSWQFWWD